MDFKTIANNFLNVTGIALGVIGVVNGVLTGHIIVTIISGIALTLFVYWTWTGQ